MANEAASQSSTTDVVTLLRVEITVRGRWAVGGVERTDEGVNLPLLTERLHSGEGLRPWLPGTTLAGALRQHLRASLGASKTDDLLGRQQDDAAGATTKVVRSASPLAILGAQIHETVTVSTFGSTAIDAPRGAARPGTLRQAQAAAPADGQAQSTLVVAMEYPGLLDTEALEAIAAWRPFIGRGRSVGLGRAYVTRIDRLAVDLSDVDHLLWWCSPARPQWLKTGLDALPSMVNESVMPRPDDHPSPSIVSRFTVREPLHVGSGDKAPGSGSRDGEVLDILRYGPHALIPGSTWKGVFRHRVHYILQALSTDPQPIVAALFGDAKKRGRLFFEDTIIDGDETVTLSHVAIDRFTGGARDTALYKVRAVPRGVGLDLTITWNHSSAVPPSVVNLLQHVMRDLNDGLIGVGGGGTRGYGWLSWHRPDDAGLHAVDPHVLCADLHDSLLSTTREDSVL